MWSEFVKRERFKFLLKTAEISPDSFLSHLIFLQRKAGLVCAISGQTVDTVQLSVYTFIGFILGVVILLLLQLVAFLFRDKKMTGVIDLE